ncbi:MAG: allantoinase AllB [Armatimonadota bacterium]|nr:allantoinase AllB [Armatimonadota bacterium]MDR7401749.1 allantoinase AllB [Armatimonadota bacterium]MDR7404141.1 allantoinase AllB [Armatimonadota bacterium]MDR7436248.1 allantoinase AllB [Armatimonadota bacterium]MDR7471372.1 allantoinase AllB [Armatimonadota bacterium]
MTYDRVVAGGRVVTPSGVVEGYLGIRAGRIASLSTEPLGGEDILDARGRVVLPGAVDLHVHFNEPGRTRWEGWGPGSRAAAAGGVTTAVEMPLNANPPTTTVPALQAKVEAAQSASVVDFALWGGLVPDNLEHLDALAAAGVVGFKAFLCPTGTPEFGWVDDGTLYEGMRRIARAGLVLAVHAENAGITGSLAARLQAQGRRDRRAWAESRPPVAELEAIQRAVLLASRAGCRLHVVHLSVPEGADLVARAQAQGQQVTVETCPHYLTLTDDDLVRLGPVAKCAPPLRDRPTVERLWEQVLAGRVHCLASDHSPCPTEDKARGEEDIWLAWGGITGVQTLVPLVLTEGVRRGLSLEQAAALLAAAPARIAGLWPRKGTIQVGADADLVVVDPDRRWTVDRGWLRSRHPHSPFVGWQMQGWITHVLRRGQVIVQDGDIVAEAGGQWIRPLRGQSPT